MSKFTNKHNVRISAVERKYFNSVRNSVNRASKLITDTLKPYTPETYLRKKSSPYAPMQRSKTINSFKTKEEFNKELEKLIKLKQELSPYKLRKPKYFDELPKRFKNDIETIRATSTRVKGPKRSSIKKLTDKQKNIEKILKIPYINNKNEIYRENIMKAVYKTFTPEDAETLLQELNAMTEAEFLQFIISRPNETISYVYYNPNQPSIKHQSLYNAIQNVKV